MQVRDNVTCVTAPCLSLDATFSGGRLEQAIWWPHKTRAKAALGLLLEPKTKEESIAALPTRDGISLLFCFMNLRKLAPDIAPSAF